MRLNDTMQNNEVEKNNVQKEKRHHVNKCAKQNENIFCTQFQEHRNRAAVEAVERVETMAE